MKKTFINIFAVVMAVLVFYGGAGINVISYCCKECRSAGIEALIDDKCCEIHHHNHDEAPAHAHKHSTAQCHHKTTVPTNHEGDHHSDNSNHASEKCCDSFTDHSDRCNMERIDFDWSSQNTTESGIDISPNVYELFSNNIFISSSAYLHFTCEHNTVMPNGPPLGLPRDYLSLLTVLLI